MPHWYWDRTTIQTKTPSIQDGIDYATEYRYRKEGARFIIDVGAEMDLGYNTLATGVVFFHRFYMFHSFKEFPRYVTACCCLFLAGKVEETPKKCKDIIKVAQNILSEEYFASFGDDPKEEVMILEKILLQTIKFDLKVQHPYSYLTKYAKCLKGDKAKLQKMVQMAWTFINDSLCTTLSIEWEPEIIAIAVMYLAGKLIQFKVIDWSFRQPKHLRWWDVFVEDLQMDVLEDICHQILDLYPPVNGKNPEALPAKDSQNSANNVRPQATISTNNIFKGSNIHITTTVTVTVTTNTTTTTTTTNTIINSITSPSVYKSYLKNSENMNTSSFDDSSRNLPNPATPNLPWSSTVPFTPRNTQCSLTAPKTDSTIVPSPSVNFPNLYGTSENAGYYKNDSPTLNCSIDHKIFDQMMENQYKSSMDHQNMSFFDKMDRPYYKYSNSKTANSPEWFRRRRGYNRNGDDYLANTTNRNFRRHRRTNYSQQFYD